MFEIYVNLKEKIVCNNSNPTKLYLHLVYVPWIVALDLEVFPASCLCSFDSSHPDGGLHMFTKVSYALEGESLYASKCNFVFNIDMMLN
jgi:hypothetical protein